MRRSKLLSRTLLMSANTLTKRFLLLIALLLALSAAPALSEGAPAEGVD